MYRYICIDIYIYRYVCIYINVCVYIYIYIYMCTHVYIIIYIFICIRVYVHKRYTHVFGKHVLTTKGDLRFSFSQERALQKHQVPSQNRGPPGMMIFT